jgi:hypothetical protein
MKRPNTNTEPERVRRKLAEAYRREAERRGRKKPDRAAFLRMAEAWEKTLS